MIKISHEIPKTLFEVHDLINDYPYVLAHLLMKDTIHYDETYSIFYKDKLKDQEFSILDNSAFELEKPIDSYILHELGEQYNPTHVIVPDFLRETHLTIKSFQEYCDLYPIRSYKLIGVLQGKNIEENIECCDFYLNKIEDKPDIIAIPFDCESNYDVTSRVRLVDKLKERFGSQVLRKFHLLGCLNPLEYKLYSEESRQTVFSTDTSCPIVTGWSGIELHSYGYTGNKPKDKLAENLDIPLSSEQLRLINKNIKTFRTYVK